MTTCGPWLRTKRTMVWYAYCVRRSWNKCMVTSSQLTFSPLIRQILPAGHQIPVASYPLNTGSYLI